MRIVFLGTPDFAVPSLIRIHQSRHQIVAVVTQPDRRAGRGLKLQSTAVKKSAIKLGYPILQPESLKSDEFYSQLNDCFPDVLVVIAFRILPERIFSLPPLGAINAHASLLPKYRGAAPVHRAILNGDKKTGVTTFQIARHVDTGNILLQKSIPINDHDTTGSMWGKLAELSADLLLDTLNKLADKSITPLQQKPEMATPAPKISRDETRIDWGNSTAREVHNRIRAFSPFPGAYTLFKGKRMKLFNSDVINNEYHDSLNSGIVEYKDDELIISCSIGSILVREVQVEGKRRIGVREFAMGSEIRSGDRFDPI